MDFRNIADVRSGESLSNRFRDARFSKFRSLIKLFDRPVKILDVGGTIDYWVQRGAQLDARLHITVLNLEEDDRAKLYPNIESSIGDATDLSQYSCDAFDVVYSNSVIEHLYSREAQARCATEILRVGCAYWVQTPSYWFPIEPHFLVPGWQWLPRSLRIFLIRRFRCGWRGPASSISEAEDLVDEVRLLNEKEFGELFPSANIWRGEVPRLH